MNCNVSLFVCPSVRNCCKIENSIVAFSQQKNKNFQLLREFNFQKIHSKEKVTLSKP